MSEAHCHIDLPALSSKPSPFKPLERCIVHVEPECLPQFAVSGRDILVNGSILPTTTIYLAFELFELYVAEPDRSFTTDELTEALDIELVLIKQGFPRHNPQHFVLRLLTAARNLAVTHLESALGLIKWFPYEDGAWRLYHLSSDYLGRRQKTLSEQILPRGSLLLTSPARL